MLEIKPHTVQHFTTHLHYSFKEVRLLRTALTHKSYPNRTRKNNLESTEIPEHFEWENNEKLEFLGDAVLDLAISSILMTKYDYLNEGELSKIRAALVNEKILSEIARKISLGHFLLMGKGEDFSGGRLKSSILADAFEAIIGAIYLDSGINSIISVLGYLFTDYLIENPIQYLSVDHKTNLQELVQKYYNETPSYIVKDVQGPDHDRVFTIDICLQGKTIGTGMGKSKKEAAQEAAHHAITLIKQEKSLTNFLEESHE